MTQVLKISIVALLGWGCLLADTVLAADLEPDAGRLWPIGIDINLTSSFGEYRSGHLHAGIDIKTFGREGVPCQAVGDGYVSRMRASPDGYGKAVYLKLDSGETVVYAHLAEFASELEHALYDGQIKADRYRVDLYFDADRFPVSLGEIIGYTGRTGASAPHLHFEVRDEKENPLNPLSQGWSLEDRTSPDIKGALFVPLSKGSLIEGACRAGEVKLRRVGTGRYIAADTLELVGRVGVGAYIIDRLNASSGRLAPYSVELMVDGVLLSSIAFESFTYGHTGEVELAYEMERVRSKRQNYLLLFRRRGETLWNRTFINDGVIETELLASMVGERKDVYTIVVRAVDRAGNVSAALIPFRVADAPNRVVAKRAADLFFFEDLLSVRPGLADVFASAVNPDAAPSGNAGLVLTVGDVTASGAQRVFDVSDNGRRNYVVTLHAGEPMTEQLADLGIEIVSGRNTLYSDVFLYAAEWDGNVGPRIVKAGLATVAAPVEIGPLSLAVRKPMQIRLYRPGGPDEREAFYRLDKRKNEWNYETSELFGDTLVTGLRRPGVYGVFVDKEPPRVTAAAITKRKSFATGELIREVVIPIEDPGSGVDDEQTIVRLDGARQISRWDGFTNQMFVRLRGETTKTQIEVSVAAVDHVGNRSESKSIVTLKSED